MNWMSELYDSFLRWIFDEDEVKRNAFGFDYVSGWIWRAAVIVFIALILVDGRFPRSNDVGVIFLFAVGAQVGWQIIKNVVYNLVYVITRAIMNAKKDSK